MEVSGSSHKKKKYKMCEATNLTDLDKHKIESIHKNRSNPLEAPKQNQVGTVMLFGVPIVSLVMDGKERLCLAQISSTLLKEFSYNEIHNRRVALGITCIQCTPVQLEILRRAGAMPVTSRRCGMITRREAERLCQSFLGDHAPPQLPENFAFDVYHECAWGCRGAFVPSRYNSSRAKCIRCSFCQLFFSPNKFIFHSHRLPDSRYVQPDAANFNSWRRHLKLCGDPPDEIVHAWEDVKAMFNGGTRKRLLAAHSTSSPMRHQQQRPPSHSNAAPKNNITPNHSSPSSSSSSSSQNNNNNSNNIINSSRAVTPQTSRHGSSSSFPHNNNGCDLPAIAPSSSSFITASSPLLSPASRIESIWNPGISSAAAAAAAAAAVAARQCHINPSAANPALPPLPFHPLSIPWLRRPALFPFSHPFGPTVKLFGAGENANGVIPPDSLLASSLATRQSQQVQGPAGISSSAFKPVGGGRGSEQQQQQLLSWFNNNSIHNNILHPTLPEDLSIGSHPHCPPTDLHHEGLHHIKAASLAYTHLHHHAQDSIKEMLTSPVQSDSSTTLHSPEAKKAVEETSIGNNRSCGSVGGDSDDEENVDIESTEADREGLTLNGYPPAWINSINVVNHNNNNNCSIKKLKRSMGAGEGALDIEENHHHRGGKKKRLWDCDKRIISASHHYINNKDTKQDSIIVSSASSRSSSATPELLPLNSNAKDGPAIVSNYH